ncbi:MAG TPA: hypothetical protein VFA98_11695 [Thermoanaerobaculia bacterium]|nr:hypothetical protein [Thermoanaerobaculia bacterium]
MIAETRRLTPEQVATVQSPEYQARMSRLVDEPGQKTLAVQFLAPPDDDGISPLKDLHLNILLKCAKPLSSRNWEANLTLWELGDEVTAAYGLLTARGLLHWRLLVSDAGERWFVGFTTTTGLEVLEKNKKA